MGGRAQEVRLGAPEHGAGPVSANSTADVRVRQASDNLAGQLLTALSFAARKHTGALRRTGEPYINHPVQVAELLATVGGVSDPEVLQAAVLHDVLEDTPTEPKAIADGFGLTVCSLVREVTDDMGLPQEQRQTLQVQRAPHLSSGAKQIRIADKIANIRDLTLEQPAGWSLERKRAYLNWAEAVVDGCRGCNLPLEKLFDSIVARRRQQVATAG